MCIKSDKLTGSVGRDKLMLMISEGKNMWGKVREIFGQW